MKVRLKLDVHVSVLSKLFFSNFRWRWRCAQLGEVSERRSNPDARDPTKPPPKLQIRYSPNGEF